LSYHPETIWWTDGPTCAKQYTPLLRRGGIIIKVEMVCDFERIINGSALFVPANKWVIPKGFFSGIYTVIFEGYLKVRLYFILLYLRHYLI